MYRPTGPGGQSVNTTDSAVRITHVPTGVVVAMQDEKSQLQNKVKAMRVLRARLYELESGPSSARSRTQRAASQIGSGERAEKIRTYNYAESRVTDHRVKLTQHRLDAILEGELDDFTEALAAEERQRARDGVCLRAREALTVAAELAEAGCPSPRVDAEWLLADALSVSRSELQADGTRESCRRRSPR